jgi:hypothetical protein
LRVRRVLNRGRVERRDVADADEGEAYRVHRSLFSDKMKDEG